MREPDAAVRSNPGRTWRKRAMPSSSPPPTANGDARTVRLTIPAKAEYITLVRLALSGLSSFRPLDEETLGDLKLAVTEACSNSVRHAYSDGREGSVEVVYELHPDRLVVGRARGRFAERRRPWDRDHPRARRRARARVAREWEGISPPVRKVHSGIVPSTSLSSAAGRSSGSPRE